MQKQNFFFLRNEDVLLIQHILVYISYLIIYNMLTKHKDIHLCIYYHHNLIYITIYIQSLLYQLYAYISYVLIQIIITQSTSISVSGFIVIEKEGSIFHQLVRNGQYSLGPTQSKRLGLLCRQAFSELLSNTTLKGINFSLKTIQEISIHLICQL